MQANGPMTERLQAAAQVAAQDLTTWRRHLHMYPEISFAEHETTAWLANRMEEWGISYTRPTPTGLVGEITGNRPGKTVAIRADIDALPIAEANEFDFKSRNPGAMHACGHDGHTAILLGLSRFLAGNRDFPGRVKLLFQPAEERPPGGAQQFINAGVLNDVDACIGLHLMSDIPTGRAGICDGPMMANSDGFTARIQGRGGHGASPHKTVDAVMVACHAVVNLQSIVSRKVDPTRPAVVTVGAIHAGTTFNVIADSAELKGTVRSFHTDLRQYLHDEVQRTLETTCAMYGATVEFEYQWGYPACVNHPAITAVMRQAAGAVLGDPAVFVVPKQMGGEDFAYYGLKVPAAFLFVGCQNPAVGAEWEHHHPRFTVDEAALPQGMEILGRAALTLLG
ncbi:MAG TPA: amidohydrolase [Symbiobacteriaceae bacterium]|jgi:amidohydrolase